MTDVTRLIEENNPDPLIRLIDELCNKQQWDEIVELANRCRAAMERGKTLWGVEAHAYYRLALEAPGEFAALAITTDPGAMPLGPLSEVAASTHTWEELTAHLQHGPMYGLTAYECVALGENLSGNEELARYVEAFELPLRLMDWEPSEYPRAEYHEDSVSAESPLVIATQPEKLRPNPHTQFIVEPRALDTWRNIVGTWITQSNGKARVASVNGTVDSAILQADPKAQEVVTISTEDAMRRICWAAASGGVHGRRRGLAFGRTQAWLVVAEACGLLDDGEMPDPDDIADSVTALQWFSWGESNPKDISLRLAVHDPFDEISFAINAYDSSDSSDSGTNLPNPSE